MNCLGFCRLTVRVCVLAFLTSTLAHASPGGWSGQGPFGGTIADLRADPTLPTRVYASTSNGFFRSDDGGSSWSVVETGLLDAHPVNGVFAVSPYASGNLWLFDDAGRLYSTADGGNNWLPTGYVLGTTPTPANQSLAHGGATTVWLAANTSGLRVSTNSGATFAAAGGGFPAGQTVTLVATNPHEPAQATQHIIASTASSCNAATGVCPIYISANGGASWSTATIGGAVVTAAGAAQHLIQVSYGPGSTVYALFGDPNYTDFYLLSSSDNGASWTARSQDGTSLAASPANALTVWIGADASHIDSAKNALKSIDGGVSFLPLGTSGRNTNGTFAPITSAIAVSPNYPGTPRLWIGTPFAGVYLSNDDGVTWTPSNDGLAATDIRALVVHPNDNTRLFAGYGDALNDPSPAFYRSTTTGTWTVANSGLNAYQLRTVMIDPTTAGTVGSTILFAVGSGFDWTGAASGQHNSGIYKSVDGGLTWATKTGGPALNNGLSSPHYPGALRTIIADPRSCDGRGPTAATLCDTSDGALQTLYATGGGRPDPLTTAHLYRVLKSTDGGASWADSSTGLPIDIEPGDDSFDRIDGVTPIVMDPSDSRILYIGTFASACDAGCFNSVDPHSLSGVYKSTNGGANWTSVSAGLPTYAGSPAVYDTLSLAIDPNNPQTLWVSTISKNFDIPGELYKTNNGGATWSLSNAGITGPDVRALLVDPGTPGTIYAASGGLGPANPGGVYKSTDGGHTWMSMSVGLPAFSALSLALDPIDSSVLYAGTTGGVYSIVQLPDLDADGIPSLVENSGPNGGDANRNSVLDSDETNVGTTAPGLFGTSGWLAGTQNASQAARASLLQQKLQAMKTAQIDSSDLQGGYFTVQVNGGCMQAVDVAPILPGPLGKDIVPHHGTYTYPRGLLRFELPQCDTASIDVIFNAAAFGPGWSWRFYGPSTPGDNSTMGWHDATSLLTNRTDTTWTMTLTKGQYGSYRPAGTGSILFEGGPAYAETIFSDKFE